MAAPHIILLYKLIQCIHHLNNFQLQVDGQLTKAFSSKIAHLNSFVKPACGGPVISAKIRSVNCTWVTDMSKVLATHYSDSISYIQGQIKSLNLSPSLLSDSCKITIKNARHHFGRKLANQTITKFSQILANFEHQQLLSQHVTPPKTPHTHTNKTQPPQTPQYESESSSKRTHPVQGHRHPLSNFFSCCFRFQNLQFPSVEHAYQYHKAMFLDFPFVAQQILKAPDAYLAKKLSKHLPVSHQWNKFKAHFMMELLNSKFTQVPRFMNFILSNNYFYTHPVFDNFWGSGRDGTGHDIFGGCLNSIARLHTQTPPPTVQKTQTNPTRKTPSHNPQTDTNKHITNPTPFPTQNRLHILSPNTTPSSSPDTHPTNTNKPTHTNKPQPTHTTQTQNSPLSPTYITDFPPIPTNHRSKTVTQVHTPSNLSSISTTSPKQTSTQSTTNKSTPTHKSPPISFSQSLQNSSPSPLKSLSQPLPHKPTSSPSYSVTSHSPSPPKSSSQSHPSSQLRLTNFRSLSSLSYRSNTPFVPSYSRANRVIISSSTPRVCPRPSYPESPDSDTSPSALPPPNKRIRPQQQAKSTKTRTHSITPTSHKTDNFGKDAWRLPKLNKPVLILGSSNLNRITRSTSSDIQIESYPGASFRHIKQIVDNYHFSVAPTHIFLSIGLNSRNALPRTTSNPEMRTMLSSIRRCFPEASIFIPKINFSYQLKDKIKSNLEQLNSMMDDLPGVTVMNKLSDSEFEIDPMDTNRIHWTEHTANAMLKFWLSHLN